MEPRDEKLTRLRQKLTLISTSYANAVNQIRSGKTVPAGTINELSDEQQKIKEQISAIELTPDVTPEGVTSSPQPGSPATPSGEPGTPSDEEEEIGIPQALRVKRHYTLSPAALEARRKNAKCRKPGNEGNKNAWKTGLHAQDFITGRIKPCLSTCPIYDDCELIKDGSSKPGGVCMDKAAVIETYGAIMEAIKGAGADKYDDFNSITALMNAEVMHVSRMLAQDIIRDGTVVKREKYDKDGKLHTVEYVSHPSLLSLAKITADLGLTPRELNITPKAIKDDKNTEEANKTAAGLMSDMARRMREREGTKKDIDDEE